MIVSIGSGAVVLLLALVLITRTWSGAPWSAPEPARVHLPRRRRDDTDDRYELAVRRGRLVTGAFDLRLRPLLREIARARLRSEGIDIDAQADEVARRLGPALTSAISPRGGPAREGERTTMSLEELDEHLRRLESL